MTTTNTFGIVFYLKKGKRKDEKAPIYARITIDGRRCDVALKTVIDIVDWNEQKGMTNGKGYKGKSLNTYLEQIRSQIVECYRHLKLKNQLVTAAGVKDLFCNGEAKAHSLMNVIDYHNAEMNTSLEWGTQKNYYTTRKLRCTLPEGKTKDIRYLFISAQLQIYRRLRKVSQRVQTKRSS